jgi:hypothetical protein
MSMMPRPSLAQVQALEDAVAWRTGRLAEPCADCQAAPGDGLCDDHACDRALIASYRNTLAVARAVRPEPPPG